MNEFTVTADHLTLLRAAYLRWDDCEFGAPAIDPKRPYGNSDVIGDIAELLDIDLEELDGYEGDRSEELRDLHRETLTVLQLAIATGEFREGTYRRTVDGWERIEERA